MFLFRLIQFPLNIIKDFDQCFYQFIWRGKTHKVKQSVMIQDFKDGGLKMIDTMSILKSEQLNWIKQYLNNTEGVWRSTMEACIGVENLNILLRGNFDPSLLKNCTPFYLEVLKAWLSIRYSPLKEDRDCSNEYLFYNKHICINGQMIYNKAIFTAGIWFVKDIFSSDKKVLKLHDLQRRGLNANDILKFNSVVSAVPTDWKKRIQPDKYPNQHICVQYKHEKKEITQLSSKEIKEIFIDKKKTTPSAKIKYNQEFDIDEKTWQDIYLLPQKLLFDNNIYETQFKILHMYIPTNKLLHRMKKNPSSTCNFCSIYCQDIFHLFYDCLEVKNFWFNVEKWFNTKYGLNVEIVRLDVFLASSTEQAELMKVIFYGKHFIVQCKHNNMELEVNDFVILLQQMIRYEAELK